MNKTPKHYIFAGALLLILAILTPILSNLGNVRDNLFTTVLPTVLVDFTNQSRSEHHLTKLTVNPLLQKAAQLKAEDMAKDSYFAHTSPAGKTSWDWFKEVNYEFLYAGENLAVNFSESSDVSKAWMNSTTHRENILDTEFSEIGIATATGIYKGKTTTFVVQMFGTPMPQTKTAYLGQLMLQTKPKMSVITQSIKWSTGEKQELYQAVQQTKHYKLNSEIYNKAIAKIIALLKIPTQSIAASNSQ